MLVAPGRLWALGRWALGREPWAQGLTRLLDSAMLLIWRYARPVGCERWKQYLHYDLGDLRPRALWATRRGGGGWFCAQHVA